MMMLRASHKRYLSKTHRPARAWVAALGLGVVLTLSSPTWATRHAEAQDRSDSRATAEQEDQQRGQSEHVGVLLESGNRRLTVKLKGTKTHTHQISPQARVTLDGREARLDDLKKGDLVQLETSREDPSLVVAIQAKRADQFRSGTEPVARRREGPRLAQAESHQSPRGRSSEETVRNRQRQVDANGPWMGVVLGTSDAQDDQSGVTIDRVYPNGPASRAGLREGDAVVQIGDRQVSSVDQFIETIGEKRVGETVNLVVLRNENRREMEVRLASRGDFFGPEQNAGRQEQDDEEFDDANDDLEFFEHGEENHRELCQHHQRLEAMIRELQQQIGSLRQEIKDLSRKN